MFRALSSERLVGYGRFLAPRGLHDMWYRSHAGGFEKAQSTDENLMKWLSEQEILPNEEPRFGFRTQLKAGNGMFSKMLIRNFFYTRAVNIWAVMCFRFH